MINSNPENYSNGHRYSVVLDENHLLNAFAYISLNPVRAGLVEWGQDWKWSSVNAHLTGQANSITKIVPTFSRIENFKALLEDGYDLSKFEALRKAEVTGRHW